MPYHVELRGSLNRARLFNLTTEELWRQVLNAWTAGTSFRVSDQTWDPRETSITILEGPTLDGPDLAYGQGWNAAEKSGRNVTRQLLLSPGTVISPTREGHELGLKLLAESGYGAVDWGPVRAALLEGREATVSAALVMVIAEPGLWLLDVGLALGGLPGRTTLVAAQHGAPARLSGVEVLLPETVGAKLRRSPSSG